jgi:hypothetical protein
MAQVLLNDSRVARCVLIVPWHGNWHADVTLDRAVTFDHRVTLAVGGALFEGTLFRSGNYYGSFRARIVGGANGWGKTLSAKGYSDSLGIRLSIVLGDAARETGETLDIADDHKIGSFYIRARGPAVRVLAGLPWYVGQDGVTHVRERATGFVTSPFQFVSGHFADGRIVLSTESPEEWIPGRSFSSTIVDQRQIRAVAHTFEPAKSRTEVWYQQEAA